MIVKKPTKVRIGNLISRLTVGQPVPADVLKYWKSKKCGEKGKETTQYDAILKAGIIGEPEKEEKKEVAEKPAKEPEKKNDSFFKS